ncbi:hypothetical protein SUGI_0737690 [Cryptomeria japonica]|nr:hypothetical protein SUGI_0737690 [Cryptomeria japonica]
MGEKARPQRQVQGPPKQNFDRAQSLGKHGQQKGLALSSALQGYGVFKDQMEFQTAPDSCTCLVLPQEVLRRTKSGDKSLLQTQLQVFECKNTKQ